MADEWKRDTPWRQGCLLPSEALSLLGDMGSNTFAVAITHDCDLASDLLDIEPNVEVLLGMLGDPSNSGNLSWGKNPRLIHLNFENEQGEKLLLEFNINNRRVVAKSELCRFEPQAYVPKTTELEAFTRWLASRYRRSAFPDAFNDALKDSGLSKKLENKLKVEAGKAVTAVLFDLTEKSDSEFSLSVVLLYLDENKAEAVAELADTITQLFESEQIAVSHKGEKITLGECYPISEDVLTLKQSRKLQKWEKDYLSFRSDPPGDMVDEV